MLVDHSKSQFDKLEKPLFSKRAKGVKERMKKAGVALTKALKDAQPCSTVIGRLIDFGIAINEEYIKNDLRLGTAISETIADSASDCIDDLPSAALLFREFDVFSADTSRAYWSTLILENKLAQCQYQRALHPQNPRANNELKAAMRRLSACSECYSMMYVTDKALESAVKRIASHHASQAADAQFSDRGKLFLLRADPIAKLREFASQQSSERYQWFLDAVAVQTGLRLKLRVWEDSPRRKEATAFLAASNDRRDRAVEFCSSEERVRVLTREVCALMALLIQEIPE